jgi:hypothetical protein
VTAKRSVHRGLRARAHPTRLPEPHCPKPRTLNRVLTRFRQRAGHRTRRPGPVAGRPARPLIVVFSGEGSDQRCKGLCER